MKDTEQMIENLSYRQAQKAQRVLHEYGISVNLKYLASCFRIAIHNAMEEES